jgi:hypothetical protein
LSYRFPIALPLEYPFNLRISQRSPPTNGAEHFCVSATAQAGLPARPEGHAAVAAVKDRRPPQAASDSALVLDGKNGMRYSWRAGNPA